MLKNVQFSAFSAIFEFLVQFFGPKFFQNFGFPQNGFHILIPHQKYLQFDVPHAIVWMKKIRSFLGTHKGDPAKMAIIGGAPGPPENYQIFFSTHAKSKGPLTTHHPPL